MDSWSWWQLFIGLNWFNINDLICLVGDLSDLLDFLLGDRYRVGWWWNKNLNVDEVDSRYICIWQYQSL